MGQYLVGDAGLREDFREEVPELGPKRCLVSKGREGESIVGEGNRASEEKK